MRRLKNINVFQMLNAKKKYKARKERLKGNPILAIMVRQVSDRGHLSKY